MIQIRIEDHLNAQIQLFQNSGLRLFIILFIFWIIKK